jgi:hypothetical protein
VGHDSVRRGLLELGVRRVREKRDRLRDW